MVSSGTLGTVELYEEVSLMIILLMRVEHLTELGLLVLQTMSATHTRRRARVPRSTVEEDTPSGRHRCKECGRYYSSTAALRVHTDMHKGLYPYHCQYCGRGFAATNNLKGHLAKHTGIKAFVCHICRQKFAYGQVLKEHMQKYHGMAWLTASWRGHRVEVHYKKTAYRQTSTKIDVTSSCHFLELKSSVQLLTCCFSTLLTLWS